MPDSSTPDTHVVFGTGAIGLALIDRLVAEGHSVRAVNLNGRAEVPDGVELVGGDASDPTFTTAATADAGAIYQCLGVPYHRWADLFPALQDGLVTAARHHGIRYVSFENTYMYGDTHGRPITETTPHRAHTAKGTVRKQMAHQLAELAAAGELDIATVRASDYFGPRGTALSPLGDLVIGAALRGKPARVLGDPDQPHSYSYTVDVARALVAAGIRPDVAGEVFHAPNAPARTTRQIIGLIADQLDTTIKVKTTPVIVLRVLGLRNPTMRELVEMLYEFDQPFIVDSTKAGEVLGLEPTPLDQALGETIAWFRRHEQTV
jgi:nucleoside-diphosphate-sugar epimerase